VTTVEIVYRYAAPPTDQVASALARVRDVYGIRQLSFDRSARSLRVEFDATRLNAAAVTNLVRGAGLEIVEELPALPAPKAEQVRVPGA
jgi:hypothetical protein